jgi:beta-lactamase class A
MLRFVYLILASLCFVVPASAETLDDIAVRVKPAVLGVAVGDLQGGPITGVNIARPFPLQSVFKAFLAAVVLDRVEAENRSLDEEKFTLSPADIRDGVGTIDHSGGGTFTLRQILRAAVIESDNTAADTLLRLIGGPGEVTSWLKEKGITGISIDRDERTQARDVDGIPVTLSPGTNASKLRGQIDPAAQRAAFAAALKNPLDTATPQAAVNFLVALQTGKLLSPAATKQLLGWMHETATGPGRLKAGLPKGTSLAHKTGTGASRGLVNLATNDIGLATLPDGRVVAIAVFLTGSTADDDARDKIIAECARAAVAKK